MKIIITGGLGFIGSYFSERLSENKSNKLIILDNMTGYSVSAYEALKKIENIEIVQIDINDQNIEEYFNNVDLVYHFAANSKISEGVNNPDIDFNVTAAGTHNVLKAMDKNKVPKIVFSSGSGVYGDQAELELSEDFGPLLPVSFYGASKLCAEAYISSFCGMKNIQASIFRFANVVGFRQTHGVAYDFIEKLFQNNSKLHVLGNGYQSKSYIDVEDIFNAIELVINKQSKDVDVFNIATTDYINVREIAEIVIEEMSLKDTEIIYEQNSAGWIGDVPIVRFSTEKIRKLGWVNKLNSKQAIVNCVKHMLSER